MRHLSVQVDLGALSLCQTPQGKMMLRMTQPVKTPGSKHHLHLLLNQSLKHIAVERGEKQIMEALDKGLDCFAQNDKTHDYEKERLEWEKEVERNRMELEKKCLDFEMNRMETEDRRAKENRQLMLQLFQCFRPPPPFSPYMAPQHFPYPPPHHGPSAESMDFSPITFTAPGTRGPAARGALLHPTSFLFVPNHCAGKHYVLVMSLRH